MKGRRTIGFGLIGTGFMGRAHAIAMSALGSVFGCMDFAVSLVSVADMNEELSRKAQEDYNFAESTQSWRDLVHHPLVDVVSITTPNHLHKEMALEAMKAGKAVYCEKPLAMNVKEAEEMAEMARSKNLVTQVGFNYMKNPLLTYARSLIQSGELGRIYHVRAVHTEDYFADPDLAWTWRLDPTAGGVLVDLGSHVLASLRYLLGPVSQVYGSLATHIPQRLDVQTKRMRTVEVEDVAEVMLKFTNGVTGSFVVSWIATGQKMNHGFEIYGEKGSLCFDQERLSELHLYQTDQKTGQMGYKKILMGPEHPPYQQFCVAPGHQLGFNDLKVIEAYDFLRVLSGHAEISSTPRYDFEQGLKIQQLLDDIYTSVRESRWIQSKDTMTVHPSS